MLDVILRPSGRFQMDAFYRGRLVERIDERNLIVSQAAMINAQLLGGAGSGIASVGFGSNSAAADIGNTTLSSDAFISAITGTVFPDALPNQVQFQFALGTGDANGLNIWEYGLLSGAGMLFARKVRSSTVGPLAKTSDWSFSGTWSISFAAS